MAQFDQIICTSCDASQSLTGQTGLTVAAASCSPHEALHHHSIMALMAGYPYREDRGPRLSFFRHKDVAYVVHTVYRERDFMGRPHSCLAHALVGPSESVDVWRALELWNSKIWMTQVSGRTLDKVDVTALRNYEMQADFVRWLQDRKDLYRVVHEFLTIVDNLSERPVVVVMEPGEVIKFLYLCVICKPSLAMSLSFTTSTEPEQALLLGRYVKVAGVSKASKIRIPKHVPIFDPDEISRASRALCDLSIEPIVAFVTRPDTNEASIHKLVERERRLLLGKWDKDLTVVVSGLVTVLTRPVRRWAAIEPEQLELVAQACAYDSDVFSELVRNLSPCVHSEKVTREECDRLLTLLTSIGPEKHTKPHLDDIRRALAAHIMSGWLTALMKHHEFEAWEELRQRCKWPDCPLDNNLKSELERSPPKEVSAKELVALAKIFCDDQDRLCKVLSNAMYRAGDQFPSNELEYAFRAWRWACRLVNRWKTKQSGHDELYAFLSSNAGSVIKRSSRWRECNEDDTHAIRLAFEWFRRNDAREDAISIIERFVAREDGAKLLLAAVKGWYGVEDEDGTAAPMLLCERLGRDLSLIRQLFSGSYRTSQDWQNAAYRVLKNETEALLRSGGLSMAQLVLQVPRWWWHEYVNVSGRLMHKKTGKTIRETDRCVRIAEVIERVHHCLETLSSSRTEELAEAFCDLKRLMWDSKRGSRENEEHAHREIRDVLEHLVKNGNLDIKQCRELKWLLAVKYKIVLGMSERAKLGVARLSRAVNSWEWFVIVVELVVLIVLIVMLLVPPTRARSSGVQQKPGMKVRAAMMVSSDLQSNKHLSPSRGWISISDKSAASDETVVSKKGYYYANVK